MEQINFGETHRVMSQGAEITPGETASELIAVLAASVPGSAMLFADASGGAVLGALLHGADITSRVRL